MLDVYHKHLATTEQNDHRRDLYHGPRNSVQTAQAASGFSKHKIVIQPYNALEWAYHGK